MINPFIDELLMGIEGALASFFHSALGLPYAVLAIVEIVHFFFDAFCL